MTEHLAGYTPDSTSSQLAYSGELAPQQVEASRLGASAVGVARVMEALTQADQPDNLGTSTAMDATGDKPDNPEGNHNAELFKHAYDAAVASIEAATRADGEDLGERIADILGSIDALSRTPYISSALKFVELVDNARDTIELVYDYVTLVDTPEVDDAVASGLSAARGHLDGTTVAYWP